MRPENSDEGNPRSVSKSWGVAATPQHDVPLDHGTTVAQLARPLEDGELELPGVSDAPRVPDTTTARRAANLAVAGGAECCVVTDAAGDPSGLLPARAMIAILGHAHSVDMARVGGYLHVGEGLSLASRNVRRSVAHRLPWLLLGLVGASMSAWMMHGFEGAIERTVELAFFVPGVVYLADAVGTQTETIVIRAFALNVPMRAMLLPQAAIGLVLALCIGAASIPGVLLFFGDERLALAIGLAAFCACATASIVALVTPWLLQRRGGDPAYGSGPMGTVIQDILSLAIYITIVGALVS